MKVPDCVADGIARYRREGKSGIGWVFMHLSGADRDAVDAWLVETGHPLAMQPGTQEHRFGAIVEELATC